MLNRLRRRASDEGGFTLIELLVVILIMGILAAIAIPTFLSQKGKASDASAKELATNAQTVAEEYESDHNGEYTGLTAAKIHEYEIAIPLTKASANGQAWLEGPSAAEGVSEVTSNTYMVTATSTTGDRFSIARHANGEVFRTCEVATGVSAETVCPNGSW